jgi:hypothetical protein
MRGGFWEEIFVFAILVVPKSSNINIANPPHVCFNWEVVVLLRICRVLCVSP